MVNYTKYKSQNIIYKDCKQPFIRTKRVEKLENFLEDLD